MGKLTPKQPQTYCEVETHVRELDAEAMDANPKPTCITNAGVAVSSRMKQQNLTHLSCFWTGGLNYHHGLYCLSEMGTLMNGWHLGIEPMSEDFKKLSVVAQCSTIRNASNTIPQMGSSGNSVTLKDGSPCAKCPNSITLSLTRW